MADTFAADLRRLRRARGLTRTRLAALAGLTSVRVSQIESGVSRPSAATAARLAAAVGAEVVFGLTAADR